MPSQRMQTVGGARRGEHCIRPSPVVWVISGSSEGPGDRGSRSGLDGAVPVCSCGRKTAGEYFVFPVLLNNVNISVQLRDGERGSRKGRHPRHRIHVPIGLLANEEVEQISPEAPDLISEYRSPLRIAAAPCVHLESGEQSSRDQSHQAGFPAD
jgi:hypothetical protein